MKVLFITAVKLPLMRDIYGYRLLLRVCSVHHKLIFILHHWVIIVKHISHKELTGLEPGLSQ